MKREKVMISIYSKENLKEEEYDRIKVALKESGNPEIILSKEFSTFNRVDYDDKLNRYNIYFDNTDNYSGDNYIKILRVEKLEEI